MVRVLGVKDVEETKEDRERERKRIMNDLHTERDWKIRESEI